MRNFLPFKEVYSSLTSTVVYDASEDLDSREDSGFLKILIFFSSLLSNSG